MGINYLYLFTLFFFRSRSLGSFGTASQHLDNNCGFCYSFLVLPIMLFGNMLWSSKYRMSFVRRANPETEMD